MSVFFKCFFVILQTHINKDNNVAMKYVVIIPARYESTRFPAKPLAILGGKPMIERVYEQVLKVVPDVYVATDDKRIYDAVEAFGGKAVMTSACHKSGTDRIAEAAQIISEKTGISYDVVVNVQGDEPFIHKSQIESVLACFDDPATQIATLGKPFCPDCEEAYEMVSNPNSPKIVVSQLGYAMYFSRSVIPFCRGVETKLWPASFPYLKHIGLYAYRSNVLEEITQLPQSPLEKAESLEQLRWLENGYRIKVGMTDIETIGIDTPADLERAESFLHEKGFCLEE